MNATVLILFYIKRAKVNKEGLVPIYARVTINSKRFEFRIVDFILHYQKEMERKENERKYYDSIGKRK